MPHLPLPTLRANLHGVFPHTHFLFVLFFVTSGMLHAGIGPAEVNDFLGREWRYLACSLIPKDYINRSIKGLHCNPFPPSKLKLHLYEINQTFWMHVNSHRQIYILYCVFQCE